MVFSEFNIKNVADVQVISIREKGVYEEIIPCLIGELCEFAISAQAEGLDIVGPVMCLYHDGGY